MASNTVTIGCRLPHGIVIEHPMDPRRKVELNGANRASALEDSEIIILRPRHYGTTQVDADLWEAWKALNAEFPAFVNGAIFEAKNESDAKSIAKELVGEATGFEAQPQEAAGIKPVKEG